jgi:hypothetical protein
MMSVHSVDEAAVNLMPAVGNVGSVMPWASASKKRRVAKSSIEASSTG